MRIAYAQPLEPLVDKAKPPRAALMVHAGAWDMPEAEREPHRWACQAAVKAGWAALLSGASAVEAVERAIVALEDDPAVNAGTGSVLTREGWVELDAGIMDGFTLEVGAVIGLRTAKNPIRVARSLLGQEHILLSGAAAEAAARASGAPLQAPEAFVTPRERERLARWLADAHARRPGGAFGTPSPRPADTVGAVAVDSIGRLAAGLSTGGACGKPSGRVGDAPIPQCGYYADIRLGAVACTGWGESILRVGLARRAAEFARDHGAQDAAWLAIRELEDRVGGRGGLILVGRDGSMGWAFNTPHMALAYIDGEMADPVVRA
jgi:beta-aspartyl-peptidase (threonine type)